MLRKDYFFSRRSFLPQPFFQSRTCLTSSHFSFVHLSCLPSCIVRMFRISSCLSLLAKVHRLAGYVVLLSFPSSVSYKQQQQQQQQKSIPKLCAMCAWNCTNFSLSQKIPHALYKDISPPTTITMPSCMESLQTGFKVKVL